MRLSSKGLQVLSALAAQPNDEFSGAMISSALSISSGTLYPMLIRFEKAGLLVSQWEQEVPADLGRPRRRYYQITGAGRSLVSQEQSQINNPLRLVGA